MATVVPGAHEPHAAPAYERDEALEAGTRLLRPHFGSEGFPWAQITGYAGSLVLTFAALVLVIHHLLPPVALFGLVLALAGGQAALQLGVFMHVRESRGPAWQVLPLGLAMAIALGLVIASIWIMAFKWGVS